MNEVYLSRSYLKNPANSLITLFVMQLLIELIFWHIAYQAKVALVEREGGLISYIGIVLRSLLIPQMPTALIVGTLLNQAHRWFRIDWLDLTWQSILRYERLFLPVLLLAYFVFIPVTETVRFLLEVYPNYSVSTYWHGYISHAFSFDMYIRYLFPVLIVGYIVLTSSLLKDILKQSAKPSALG